MSLRKIAGERIGAGLFELVTENTGKLTMMSKPARALSSTHGTSASSVALGAARPTGNDRYVSLPPVSEAVPSSRKRA